MQWDPGVALQRCGGVVCAGVCFVQKRSLGQVQAVAVGSCHLPPKVGGVPLSTNQNQLVQLMSGSITFSTQNVHTITTEST